MGDRANRCGQILKLNSSTLTLGKRKPVEEHGKARAVRGRDAATVHLKRRTAALGKQLQTLRACATRRRKGECAADLKLARPEIHHLHRIGHGVQPLTPDLPPFSIRLITASSPFWSISAPKSSRKLFT